MGLKGQQGGKGSSPRAAPTVPVPRASSSPGGIHQMDQPPSHKAWAGRWDYLLPPVGVTLPPPQARRVCFSVMSCTWGRTRTLTRSGGSWGLCVGRGGVGGAAGIFSEASRSFETWSRGSHKSGRGSSRLGVPGSPNHSGAAAAKGPQTPGALGGGEHGES